MRQFAVIGMGKFGFTVAKTLSEKGYQVLVIDSDENKVREASDFATQAVQLDATDEEALKKVGIEDVDVAIVSVGENLEASILISLMLKEIGVKEVIAKALNVHHAKVLQKIGVDRIVFPEREMGVKLAENLVSPNILEQIRISPSYRILEITAPSSFVGKTLKALRLRTKYKVNVIAIKKKVPYVDESGESNLKEELNLAPDGDEEISTGDAFVVIGEISRIEELKKEK